ncbi:MAG: c-type cytochrome domain-containing protein, partial [Bdellovibrionia bacterium]
MQSRRVFGALIILAAITAGVLFQNCGSMRGQFENSSQSISAQAKTVLSNKCAACHGTRSSGSGGFKFVLDHALLISSRFVVPGDPDGSKIYQRVADGTMPRGSVMSDSELTVLRDWISDGAPEFEPEPELRPVPVTADSDEDILNLVYEDMAATPSEQRRFTRYVSFHHIHNAGLYTTQTTLFERGLNKLLNSLSWQSAVSSVSALNSNKTVYKIRLNEYGFASDLWARILTAYPYSRHPQNATYQSKLSALVTLAGEEPIVRGDWLIQALSTPPLYQAALNLPSNLSALESRLGINTATNIANGLVVRSGFVNSFAAINNRIIERQDMGAGRAYWKSFEFPDNTGTHSVLRYPLGPSGVEAADFFESEGGEVIFDLPNGFHGYYVHDAAGNLQNQPPPNLIINPTANRGFVLGVSCFSCHSTGVNSNTDVTRNYVLNNNPFVGNRDRILALY